MSNNKYKQYNKMSEKKFEEPVIDEAPVEEVVEDIPVEEAIEETPVEEIVEEAIPTKIGVVTDCVKLNVRTAPSKTADVAKVITALTEVIVDENESTDEFYKVTTEDAIEGYCMKKFIAVNQ